MRHYYHRLIVTEDINNQILEARNQGEYAGRLLCHFTKHLVLLGLREYQSQIKCEAANREARLHAVGGEALPQEPPCTMGKIIPFPGVSLPEPCGFQTQLDDFLREMGYIE